MNRKLIVVTLAALSLSSCSLFKGGLKAPSKADLDAAAAVAQAAAEKLSKAQKEAEIAVKTCPAADGNIPLTEEKGVGGAIMVALANENGDFLVDGVLPELNTKADKVKVDMKKAKNNVNAYVAKVGKLLASYSTRPELPWTFGVVENDGVNAFSAPGGYVAVTTGLMRLVENEAQLAGVLGHEIGHIVNKDVLKSYASVKHNICVPAKTVAAYAKYGIADQLPESVRKYANFSDSFEDSGANKASNALVDALTDGVLSFKKTFGAGKDAEFAADRVGFELMMFAGYDTKEFDTIINKAGKGGKVFDNHPSNDDRLKNFDNLRTGVKKDDGSVDPEKPEYSLFAYVGVVPPLPADVKAAIPAEGTVKPKAAPPPAADAPKDGAAKETPKS
jgi:Zn-dependent protease with chaperone function